MFNRTTMSHTVTQKGDEILEKLASMQLKGLTSKRSYFQGFLIKKNI